MPKRTKYVVIPKEKIQEIMVTAAGFQQGETTFFVEPDNKIGGCVVSTTQPSDNGDPEHIYDIVEFARKEIDDILIERYKQDSTSGGISIHYQQRNIIDPDKAAEHLFEVVVIRYGAEVHFNTINLTNENETTNDQ